MLFVLSVFCVFFPLKFSKKTWHKSASDAMKQVKEKGGVQLTVETVLRSNGKYTLDDVYTKYGLKAWIYNVEPAELGFYCLYRKRENDTHPPVEDCEDITKIATRHAKLLVDAGIDYVAMDHTNWPRVTESSDIAVLRPTEVLFEEWRALRDKGVETPQIAIWPCSPPGSDTWKWFLDNIYNKEEYQDLIFKRENGKKVIFIPSDENKAHYCMPNDDIVAQMLDNGGRKDTTIINMWCMFDPEFYKSRHWWGFFTPCLAQQQEHHHASLPYDYTMSIVGEGECNQPESIDEDGNLDCITASASYQYYPEGLPFCGTGKLRGLTLQKLFKSILEKQPPNVFLSSFNEHVGGRAHHPFQQNTGFNMGLPDDPQKWDVWFDTYGYEFSRDMEPTVEGGDHIWKVLTSCIHLYKTGQTCKDAPSSLCCSTEDKDIWFNVWSLRAPNDGPDRLLTTEEAEKTHLVSTGWIELCNVFAGPSVFCVNTTDLDGRDAPFMLYSKPQEHSRALYRCLWTETKTHFFSTDEQCEGHEKEGLLGYVSENRGSETLRALRRCFLTDERKSHVHALDLPCDFEDTGVLGYVR